MPLRFFIPLPGPVVWTPKTKAEKRATAPAMTPERAAESRHESRHAVRWVLFGCLAIAGLAIQGATALWYLIPLGFVVLVVQLASSHEAATASPAQTAERAARRQITARATWDPQSGCTWCGSPAWHKNPAGAAQAPAQFHEYEINAAIAARVKAELSQNNR